MGESWETVAFGDVIQAIGVGDSPRCLNRPPRPEEWGVLKISAIRPGRFVPSEAKTLPLDKAPKLTARFAAGDLLVTRSNTLDRVGAACVAVGDVSNLLLSDLIFRIRLDEAVLLHEFAAIALGSRDVRGQIEAAAVGTSGSMKKVNQTIVRGLQVPAPPIEEQRRIVDLLASVRRALAAATSEADAAAKVAARLRAHFLVDPEFGQIPLADCVEVAMGRQRSPKHQVGDHLVPYLRAANVKDGFLALGDVLTMNFTPKEQEKFRLLPSDVLVTEGCGSLGQIGANAVWEGEIDGPVCFQNTLLRLRAIEGITTPSFVAHWARHAFESGGFAAVSSGTNIFHVGAERAATMPFPRVPVDRQVEITRVLDHAEAAVQSVRGRIAALESVRVAVSSVLLSARHKIPESYDRFLSDGRAVSNLAIAGV